MFHLLTIEDRVRIPPNDFNSEVQTIEDEIEKKYVSKVVLSGGLFIALYDILGTGDSYVYPGDGAAHLMVRFRMVVFKPFKGEIMEGIIKKSTKDQIQISLGFFDEIYLNPIELPTPSSFSEEEVLWYWDWNDNQLFFENGERIRFRVEQIEFNPEVSQPAPAPKNLNTDGMDAYTLKEYKERQLENERLLQQVKSPLILKVSVKDSGLGMIEWWTGQDAGNDEEDDEQQEVQEDQQDDEDDENYQQMNEEYSNKNNFDEGEGVEDAQEEIIINKIKKNNTQDIDDQEEIDNDYNSPQDKDQILNDIEEEPEEEIIQTKSKRKSTKKDIDTNTSKSRLKKGSVKKTKPSEELSEEQGSSEEEIKKSTKSKGRGKKK